MTSTMDADGVVAKADRDFPALFQLFGGYFHQDWREEYETPAAALTAFVEEAPPDAVGAALNELQRLLQLPIGDAGLGRVLRDGFGCSYVPRSDGLSDAEWLTAVRRRLQPGA